MTWRFINDRNASIVIETGFRRSFITNYNSLTVGKTFTAGVTLWFGDGTFANVTYTITSLNIPENWIIGRAVYNKKYPNSVLNPNTNTLYRPYYTVGARLSSTAASPVNNNADGNLRCESFIDLRLNKSAPVVAAFPTVVCALIDTAFAFCAFLIIMCTCSVCYVFAQSVLQNQTRVTISIPACDVDDGVLTYRFSTPAEMGGSSLRQPPNLMLDANSGCASVACVSVKNVCERFAFWMYV